jgi:hypothetical protein
MEKTNRCSRCGKIEYSYHYREVFSATNLPVGWCYLIEKGCGVHDSDTVEFVYKYILCDDCREKVRKLLEKEGEK